MYMLQICLSRKLHMFNKRWISFFLLDIFFTYISNAIQKVPYTLPLPCSLTHPLLLLALVFPRTEAYKVCNTKGPLFPVIDN